MNIACILVEERYPTYAEKRIYGLTMVERLYRQFRESGFDDVRIVHDLPDRTFVRPSMRLAELIHFLHDAVFQPNDQLFLVRSNIIMDDRLIRFTRDFKEDVLLGTQGGLVKLSGKNLALFVRQSETLNTITSCLNFTTKPPEGFSIRAVNPDSFDAYIEDLRLSFIPYYFHYEEGTNLGSIENQMYEANFKGTLDFIAMYVYKYPVREITRFLSRYHWITPNQITFLSVVSSFAVPALFATGLTGWAIVTGWCMFILDSVDGKLARLTIRLSRISGMIEHATSAPAIFFWFVGLAWHFTDGHLLDDPNASTAAGWTLMALYWIDKGVNWIFRIRHGRDMYDYSRLDRTFHLFACRRAIILLIITIGYFLNLLRLSFHFLAFWMICSFLFHLLRLLTIPHHPSNKTTSSH